jgi:hypothetical protein
VNDEKAEIEEKTTGEVQSFSATQKMSVYVNEKNLVMSRSCCRAQQVGDGVTRTGLLKPHSACQTLSFPPCQFMYCNEKYVCAGFCSGDDEEAVLPDYCNSDPSAGTRLFFSPLHIPQL